MERRKAYIITALITLTLITALSGWYLYLARQQASFNDVTELDYYTIGEGVGIAREGTSAFGGAAPEAPNTPTQPTATDPTESTPTEKPEVWNLQQLHTAPTAAATLTKVGTSTHIAFIERKTGHLLELNPTDPDAEKLRIASQTTPRVQAAHILSGNRILLIPDTSNPELHDLNASTTAILPDTPKSLIYDGAERVYYLTTETPANTYGSTLKSYSLGSGTVRTLWTSPLRGWELALVNDTTLQLTQAPSSGIAGSSYLFDITTEALTPTLTHIPGLMARFADDGQTVVYSQSDATGTTLRLRQNGTTVRLSLQTLAEKCAWGSDATLYCAVPKTLPSNLPDSWLKGQSSFSDTLWRINTTTGEATALAKNTNLDIVSIQEGEGIILFKNKTDQSLWSILRE